MGMVAAIAVAVITAMGQTSAFEVVSVKPNRVDPRNFHRRSGCLAGGRFVASDVPLKYIIEWAYDIRSPFSVPDWAASANETYNIDAKPASPVSPEDCRRMVQSVREDRFKLKLHRETREMPVYSLIAAKGGSKVRKASDASEGVWMQGHRVSARP